jgi:predicted neuraminidase
VLRQTLALVLAGLPAAAQEQPRAIAKSEFLYDSAPFPSAHASTIVETPAGLVAAWFGGTREKHPDVGIWVSRLAGGAWSAPAEVANGVQPDGTRLPCWNPVLFQPSQGPLLLFYKVGPSPSEWWGHVRTSKDDGRTWSDALRLPDGILGPIRAKPIELPGGDLLAGSSTEHAGWVVHMERFAGRAAGELQSPAAWRKSAPLNDRAEFGAIQPTILEHSKSRLQILCRSQQGVITEAWSEDGGKTWGKMTATSLPNPSAGIDALRLEDGRFLLVYNPAAKGRGKLEIAVSRDGRTWRRGVVLEDTTGEFSYPALIQSKDGLVHVTYTWQRQKIKHVVVDPARID